MVLPARPALIFPLNMTLWTLETAIIENSMIDSQVGHFGNKRSSGEYLYYLLVRHSYPL